MRNDVIPAEVATAVKGRLGPIYDELLVVMIDLGVLPIFLFGDDRPRLVDVRARAVACLEEWIAAEPSVEHLVSRLPRVMQLDDAAASLLEAAPWADYFDVPESAFAKPD